MTLCFLHRLSHCRNKTSFELFSNSSTILNLHNIARYVKKVAAETRRKAKSNGWEFSVIFTSRTRTNLTVRIFFSLTSYAVAWLSSVQFLFVLSSSSFLCPIVFRSSVVLVRSFVAFYIIFNGFSLFLLFLTSSTIFNIISKQSWTSSNSFSFRSLLFLHSRKFVMQFVGVSKFSPILVSIERWMWWWKAANSTPFLNVKLSTS